MRVRRDFDDIDDGQPVIVPRNDKALIAVTPERVRRLREHLIGILRGLRTAKHLDYVATPTRPEPAGFAGLVARTACSLCKGWCCRNGDDDAFLDEATLARVRLAKRDLPDSGMVRLYLEHVPKVAYRDSCIFHGKQGCTLDRSLRADVCGLYYCGGLSAFMKSGAVGPAKVFAGEGDKMRTSPVLKP